MTVKNVYGYQHQTMAANEFLCNQKTSITSCFIITRALRCCLQSFVNEKTMVLNTKLGFCYADQVNFFQNLSNSTLVSGSSSTKVQLTKINVW